MSVSNAVKKVFESDISTEIATINGIKKSIADLTVQLEARELKLELMLEAIGADRSSFGPGMWTEGEKGTKYDFSKMKFRDIIREILRSTGEYMTAREIADNLGQIGYEYTGTTEITTRLGNDLSRMVAQGNVLKGSRQEGGRSFVVYKILGYEKDNGSVG